ncbi:MAG: T9SS type A sorting domain-containing protein [Chlorobi bacterium]|nr:T9SS type A sorting domain-containing protein [Chlorobiota bacterium]
MKLLISDVFWEQLYFPDTAKIYCIDVNDNGDIFVGSGGTNEIGGVYRSTDNAESWEFVNNIGNASVLSIDISPQGDVFAGSNNGWEDHLLRSSDNGDSWQEITLPDYSVAENVIKILAVSTDTIYVSTVNNNALLLRTYDGGQTWDSLVGGNSHPGEYISDILIDDDGTIFLSYQGFYQDQGGVYYSEDDGANWQFSGLLNYMITSLARNSSNDIFAGCWGGVSWDEWPGLYVLRNGEAQWDTLIAGPQIGDIEINSDNYIFFTSQWPLGISRSIDNGESFELVNEGLPPGYHNNITLDNNDYLYATSGDNLSKTINTTVDIPEYIFNGKIDIVSIFPNPASTSLTITIDNQYFTNNTVVSLSSIIGKTAYKKTLNNSDLENGSISIDVSGFKKGTYIASLNNNGKTISSTKMIITN